ncbi:helix-turn-helix transcriptional regulator [Rhizobium bangladeshense]|uniref:helix-turn-helix transcriptional regulator n=1 Tax=Rhizobium bangladeshense TaxID=1138189 RepID=UPI002180D04E|nr:helix-turn-helix domain-containing protein [Rhizobium bangladeshense]
MLDISPNQRRMLRTDDAAIYTGVSASTLNKLRLTGGGPDYLKLGKSVVYDPADLDAWLSSKRRRSTSAAA